jgi:membrane-bound lytic murein transglycosylase B
MQLFKKALICLLLLTLSMNSVVRAQVGVINTRLSQQPTVSTFINQMVKKHNFSKKELVVLFDQVQIQAPVIASVKNPKEGNPWYIYRKHFLNEDRVSKGSAFWQEHKTVLAKTEKDYGVPASVIVAILGVETYYGTKKGKYRVIDALSTLAFGYSPRAPFFTRELEQYLLMTRENKLDPLAFRGSYAGAMGQPQFMPSSYRAYAVSYQGRTYKNLETNTDDSIVSIANYLRKNGWHPYGPIAEPATVSSFPPPIKSSQFKPEKTLTEYKSQGIKATNKNITSDHKAALIALQSPDGHDYWLGFQNFYAITRYNPSINYAMAVFQLSQLLEKNRSPN